MANSPSLFDKRVVQRSISKGLIDAKQYQRILDELPDLSHNVAESEPLPVPTVTESAARRAEFSEPVARIAASSEQSEPNNGDEQIRTRPFASPEPIGNAGTEEHLQAQAPVVGPEPEQPVGEPTTGE